MTIRNGRLTTHRFVVLAIVFTAMLMLVDHALSASAQSSPFGGPRPGGAPVPVGGVVGWLLAKQAEYYRQFSGLIRAAKADGSAAWSLFGLSFLYGIFHAAGPGHGKAVISSYLVANGETWVRGVVLALASALLQAAVAIAIVGVAAAMLNVRALTMNNTVNMIETASYALIVLIGARLLWVKGRSFLAALRTAHRPISEVGAAMAAAHHDHHRHAGHSLRLSGWSCQCQHGGGHDDCGDDGAHDHDASAWGHAHAPEPQQLGGPGGWKRGLAAVVAVGLRPCSGAILILVFATAQDLFFVGAGSALLMGVGTFITVATIAAIAVLARASASRLAAARPGYGTVAMRGVEAAAAALITTFGVLLFLGYIVNERMIGF